MPSASEVIYGACISNDEIASALEDSIFLTDTIMDRKDLHDRGYLERFIDIAMGEIAEKSVLAYLRDDLGLKAESAVDKRSGHADLGYDIIIEDELRCSVKSSLSIFKSNMTDILAGFNLATKRSEVVDVNVQVYFWLDPNGHPRSSVPSELNMAIIGWAGAKDLYGADYDSYVGETREAASMRLIDLRPMSELGYAVRRKLEQIEAALEYDDPADAGLAADDDSGL